MGKEGFNRFLYDNITKTYKKSKRNTVNNVSLDVKKIADNLSISDTVDQVQKNEA